MRLTTACTALLVATAVACGGGLEPGSITGTWYLQTYNDSAMPGVAVFRSGGDSSLVAIDSVRLGLQDGSICTWLVDLTDQPANSATTCAWTTDAGADDLLVTVDGGFQLRGAAASTALTLRDPNGNRLAFGREPAVRDPQEPDPL